MADKDSVEIYVGPNSYVTEVTVELSERALDEIIEEHFDGLCLICRNTVKYPHKICSGCLLDELSDYGQEVAQDVREMFGG